MKLEELSNIRGEIAEKFIGIEGVVDTVISYHYFKKFNFDFVFNLLRNENSNFGLRRNVFENIIIDFNGKQDIVKGIHRLNKIRNIFLHSLAQCSGPDADIFFKNTVIGKKDLDAEQLYQEFLQIHEKTINLIFSLGSVYGLNEELKF